MMYTMPKNLLSICVNFALATQHFSAIFFDLAVFCYGCYNVYNTTALRNTAQISMF